MKLLYPALIGLLFVACTKESNISTDAGLRLLVVNCLFTPDSVWTVYLARTKALKDTTSSWISDAVVEISADGQLLERLVPLSPGCYVGKTKPSVGVEYTLRAAAPGLPEVIGKDRIPAPVLLTDATAGYKQSSEPHCDPSCTTMGIRFADPPQETNFYEVEVYRYHKPLGSAVAELEYLLGYTEQGGAGFGTSTDPVLLSEGDLEYEPSTPFFSDKLFNGDATANVTFDLSGRAQFGGGGLGAIVRLRSVSEQYYAFRKSWTRHRNRQWISANGGNAPGFLFYPPPLALVSTVKGGLGVFAGFSSDTLRARE